MRKMLRRVLAVITAVACAFALLPAVEIGITAKAAEGKTVTGLGTTDIAVPTMGGREDRWWCGNYVWYGNYDGKPVRYRALNPHETKFGGDTLFLDCDRILYNAKFDEDGLPNSGADAANEWAYSDIRAGLNGDAFLTKPGVFTDLERNAIANSVIASHPLVVGSEDGMVSSDLAHELVNYVALTGEKIFLMDIEDVVNAKYGYRSYYSSSFGTKELKWEGESGIWFLRNANAAEGNEVGYVSTYGGPWTHGRVNGINFDSRVFGASPAFNINLSSIIFSSCITGEVGNVGAEYSLTIEDKDLQAEITSGKTVGASGSKITVPYTIKGAHASDATQMSVLILDRGYVPGNSNGAQIKYYGKLETGSFSTSGTGTFTLPAGCSPANWGKTYFVYILAEQVNGKYATDYASAPKLIPAPGSSASSVKLTFNLNGGTSGAPAAITAECGAVVTIPKSSPVRSGCYFQGWSESKTATTAEYKSGSKLSLVKNVTLYAVWKRATYKLTFDANGGTGTIPPPISALYGSTVTVPKCTTLTRSGYYFMGWSTSKTATTAAFKSGSTITLTGNTVLYAVWKSAGTGTCTLSFDRNGGSGNAPAKITAAVGSAVTVPKSSITREGYYFMGWSTTRGGAVAYKSGDEIMLTKDTVLYAVWKVKTVTLSFDRNGGSGNAPVKVTTTYGSIVTIEKCSVTREGYWFMGWSTVRNGEVKYKTGSKITLKENTVLYAVWKKK